MLKFRLFRPADLEALYSISLVTGHKGGDASNLYQDGRLIGLIYSAPYALLEPQLTLVAEDEDGVAGFAVGTLDTMRWHEKLEKQWWPKLRRTYSDPSSIPSLKWSADQRRAFAIHHPEPPPEQVVNGYPAHMHLNLHPRIQGQGAGTKLFSKWLALTLPEDKKAIHVGVNNENSRAVQFWLKQGFSQLKLSNKNSSQPIWMGRS